MAEYPLKDHLDHVVETLTHRLDRIEQKLDHVSDAHQRIQTSMGWMRWSIGGAYAAILTALGLNK